jgi:hypothetical protein
LDFTIVNQKKKTYAKPKKRMRPNVGLSKFHPENVLMDLKKTTLLSDF